MTLATPRAILVAATLALLPAAARADTPAAGAHAGVNAIYERMATALAAGDAAMSRLTYADDAIFLPAQPVGIDRGTSVHDKMKLGVERLKADGATFAIKYRVISRQLVGDGLAIDSGYYRTDMTRPSGEPRTMTRYNKMLVVSTRQPDGRWLITHDASVAGSKEAFDAATPQPGLKFDS
ncbi:MAG: DUF4440 domain-containing protein [Sphingomonadaceae bacterium]|nr:DUF4440 domain-containing protein [Sphingomonadaceae bacterium]